MKYLDNINSPEDIKKIPEEELQILADETRAVLIEKLSNTGGHVGSNLGVVELTVALHYVFSSPVDKIVWDVSHQCYPHKILTGRKEAYISPEHYKDVTGFTNTKESVHDHFTMGHSSTSVSLALGLAKARDLSGGKENIIAVTGDGALSGGEIYEGLNFAGEYGKNLIVILNDNEQSVAENHGGLYKNLRQLRESGGESSHNFFISLGFEYRYLDDGHNITKLVALLNSVKDTPRPVLLHIHTVKGKGLKYAEENREEWHSGSPFRISDGYPKNGYPVYDTTVHDSLTELIKREDKAVVLTAGTPRALGFVGKEKDELIKQGRFIDVGIAEENAMAISSGIARGGGTAVFGVYAPFIQRAYDQLSHDVCLNDNPAVILVLTAGAYGMKSNTHLGLCDIQMISHIPNIIYLAPSTKEEYLQQFRYAVSQKKHPVAIRVPVRFISGETDTQDYSETNRYKTVAYGKDIAIIAVGLLVHKAIETAKIYKEKYNKNITVINPCFLTGTDNELLDSLKADHRLIVTIEDGELDGGFGQRIASYYSDSTVKVKNFGISKEFHSDFNAEALLEENGISPEKLIEYIEKNNVL